MEKHTPPWNQPPEQRSSDRQTSSYIRDLILAADREALPELLAIAAIDALEARDAYRDVAAAALERLRELTVRCERQRDRLRLLVDELRELRLAA